jgi:hypothetical protein
MEDIIALVLVVGVFALVVVGAVKLHRFLMKKKREEEARMAAKQKAADEFWANEARKAREKTAAIKNTPPSAVQKVRKLATPSYSTTDTNTSSDDGFLTGMLVGAVLDNAFSGHSGGTQEKRDITPSWGLDDSDSRKSISDSMDTASSWFSSSSDSSSDSGPSSDW